MTKTPEQMADKYIEELSSELLRFGLDVNTDRLFKLKHMKDAFLAGYQTGRLGSEEVQAAKDQLADASKVMPQWISVKDRLPEIIKQNDHYADSNCVLIEVIKESDQELPVKPYVTIAHLAQFRSEDLMWTACRCSISGYEVEPNEWKLNQVTHWMPLPEAPKEEKKG